MHQRHPAPLRFLGGHADRPSRIARWRRPTDHRHNGRLLTRIQQLGRLRSRIVAQGGQHAALQIPPADPPHLAAIGANGRRDVAEGPLLVQEFQDPDALPRARRHRAPIVRQLREGLTIRGTQREAGNRGRVDEDFIHSVRSQLPIRGKYVDHHGSVGAIGQLSLINGLFKAPPATSKAAEIVWLATEMAEVRADPLDFGPHRILTDQQRHIAFRYADEALYAIGMYLMSLEPPRNPDLAPPDVLARGEQVFRREGCANCHTPPNYTNGKLTVAEGWTPPPNHPNRDDILPVSVGTDPGLALRTRKGTGLYKVPSLRGLWYRPRLLHDGALASLEEMFAPARLNSDYVSKGWNPPGTTTRAIPGHRFGLALDADDKAALLAFLRSL